MRLGILLALALGALGCAPQASAAVARSTEGPVVDAAARDPAAVAVAFARAQLGAPYCRGGTGPRCYDCSGLTSAAWRAAGHPIPRTSTAQGRRLGAVPLDAARPGDILWRPGHVGLYVGHGWAIAATEPGDVVRWQRLRGFVRALRP